MTFLDTLPIGKTCRVSSLLFDDSARRRFFDLGLVSGTEIKALFKSPAGDPRAYLIRGAVIALRNTDAAKIGIELI